MYLKKYHIKVVNALNQFLQTARDTKTSFDIAKQVLPENMRHTMNWVQTTFQTSSLEYKDRCTNGLGSSYPRMIIKSDFCLFQPFRIFFNHQFFNDLAEVTVNDRLKVV